MKQAKAPKAEWEALVDWFNQREANGEPVPQWRRVVFGYDLLVEHCCDPAKDYLDWKPGLGPKTITLDQVEPCVLTYVRIIGGPLDGSIAPSSRPLRKGQVFIAPLLTPVDATSGSLARCIQQIAHVAESETVARYSESETTKKQKGIQ